MHLWWLRPFSISTTSWKLNTKLKRIQPIFMSIYFTYLFSTAGWGWYKSLVNGCNFVDSQFCLLRFAPDSLFPPNSFFRSSLPLYRSPVPNPPLFLSFPKRLLPPLKVLQLQNTMIPKSKQVVISIKIHEFFTYTYIYIFESEITCSEFLIKMIAIQLVK